MELRRYRLQDVHEVFPAAQYIAQHFARRHEVIFGIHELLMNAVEHGNLGVGYAHKTELIANGRWEAEIAARRASVIYAQRYVDIVLGIDDAWSTLTIADAGDGFDWMHYLHRADDDAAHGRGLRIAQQSGFVAVHFNAIGNAVTCYGEAAPQRWMSEHLVQGRRMVSHDLSATA